MTAKAFSFSIDLPVMNQWRNVDLLRTSVQNCFVAVFADLDGCNAIAMVTGELVENAIKYGDWGADDKSFRLLVHGKPGVVNIQVDNPVAVGSSAVAELQNTLRWIESQPSAQDAFLAKMLEIASRRPPTGASGLGLVRCAYEANAKLRSELVNATTLRVTAEMQF